MDASHLKLVRILGKGHKKQLLLSASGVASMTASLKALLGTDVMVINTNLALDVYYPSEVPQYDLIKTAFLSVVKPEVSDTGFHFRSFSDPEDLAHETKAMFLRLSGMPLLFKSYTKSLFYQINQGYEQHRPMLMALFPIWQTVLMEVNSQDVRSPGFRAFLELLQELYIARECHPDLRQLLEAALAPLRVN